MALSPSRTEVALREFIAREVDYDIHKNFECDEETGDDVYPELTYRFIEIYEAQED